VQDLWDNLAAVADFLNLDNRKLTIGEELLGYHNNNNEVQKILLEKRGKATTGSKWLHKLSDISTERLDKGVAGR